MSTLDPAFVDAVPAIGTKVIARVFNYSLKGYEDHVAIVRYISEGVIEDDDTYGSLEPYEWGGWPCLVELADPSVIDERMNGRVYVSIGDLKSLGGDVVPLREGRLVR